MKNLNKSNREESGSTFIHKSTQEMETIFRDQDKNPNSEFKRSAIQNQNKKDIDMISEEVLTNNQWNHDQNKINLMGINYCNRELMVKYEYMVDEAWAPFGDVEIHSIEIDNIDITPLLELHFEDIEEIVLENIKEDYEQSR